MNVYFDSVARAIYFYLSACSYDGSYPEPFVGGIFYEKDQWVAFDNRNACMWVETFMDQGEALRWVKG